LLSGVEDQRWGAEPSRLKILQLNWQVVRMPLWNGQQVDCIVDNGRGTYATLL